MKIRDIDSDNESMEELFKKLGKSEKGPKNSSIIGFDKNGKKIVLKDGEATGAIFVNIEAMKK